VEDILRLMGYTTERNPEIHGADCDIFAELDAGAIPTRLMVECKDRKYTQSAEVGDVAKFGGLYLSLRNANKVDKALFVNKGRISPNGREYARNTGIIALSYEELFSRLFPCAGYIDRLIYDYEHYDEFAEGQRDPIIEVMGRKDLFVFYEYLNAIHLGSGNTYTPVDSFFDEWLGDPRVNSVALLGDFGMGKSSVCVRLTYHLAKAYRKDPSNSRIPIFISLRDCPTAMSLQQFITDLLLNQYGIHIRDFEVFRRVLEQGKLVLIFDAFDEMTTRDDEQSLPRNLDELNKFMLANSKTLLACRTHYFKTDLDVQNLLSQHNQTLFRTRRPRAHFEILQLCELGEKQIQEFIRKRLGNSRLAARYIKRITRTESLRDIARRPIFLEMTLALPRLIESEQDIDVVRIYDEYIEFWNQSEYWRSPMTAEEKSSLLEELAWRMFLENREAGIHHSVLAKRLSGDRETQIRSKDFDEDIRTRSLLIRDASGNYRFVHRSFMDYFVARSAAKKLRDLSLDEPSAEMLHNSDVLFFLRRMVIESDRALLAKLISAPGVNTKTIAIDLYRHFVLTEQDVRGLERLFEQNAAFRVKNKVVAAMFHNYRNDKKLQKYIRYFKKNESAFIEDNVFFFGGTKELLRQGARNRLLDHSFASKAMIYIYMLGIIGNSEDVATLKGYLKNPSVPLREEARLAVRRIQSRIKSRIPRRERQDRRIGRNKDA
jgi:hypothetical protein